MMPTKTMRLPLVDDVCKKRSSIIVVPIKLEICWLPSLPNQTSKSLLSLQEISKILYTTNPTLPDTKSLSITCFFSQQAPKIDAYIPHQILLLGGCTQCFGPPKVAACYQTTVTPSLETPRSTWRMMRFRHQPR